MSMTRLARAAGVSLSTVSHLLNGTRPVSESATAAVLRAAAEIGYEDPRLAWVSRRARTVGVIVPSAASPYFAELLDGMGTEAIRLDVGLLLMTSGEDAELEQHAVELLMARGVDGLALIPSAGWRDLSRPVLRRKELPVVLVDRIDEERFDRVGGENVAASETLVSHLLALGHRRVGLIRGLAGLPTTHEREIGYRRAHDRHGIAVDDRLVADGFSTAPGGRDAMELLMQMADRPSAVFCANNNMTVGSLAALRRLDLTIPDDVALVAFDDTEWSDLVQPGITCMAQPFHAMGIRALHTLLARIEDPYLPVETVRLLPSYEHRGSCGCREPVTARADTGS
jgi:LacI family transcriptional regulator